MPTILFRDGDRFFFFSNEGDPREPPHVHVRKGGQEAKFRLLPDVAVVDAFGFNAAELNALAKLVRQEKPRMLRASRDHFGD